MLWLTIWNMYPNISKTEESEDTVDKHAVLKRFEKLTGTVSLQSDDIRLYLLLLANCRDTGNGEIECKAIRKAFGDMYSMSELQGACCNLREHGLIEIFSTACNEIIADNSIVTYRILSLLGKRG